MSTYTGARSRTYSKLSENTAHSESETPLLQQPIVNTDHAAPLVTPDTSQCKRPTRSTVSYKSLTITDIAEEHLASLNKRKPSRWQHIKATVSNSPSFLTKTIDWIRRSPPPSDYSDTESESALTSRGNKTSPTKPLPLCITAAPGAAAASYHSDVKVSPNIILDSANSNHASPSSNDQSIRDQHDHGRTFSLQHSPIGTAINASRANQDTICRDLTPSSSRITIQPTEATGKTLISTPRKGFYQVSSGADHYLPIIDQNFTPPSSCSPIQPAEKIELSATIAKISSTSFDTTFPPVDPRPYRSKSVHDINLESRPRQQPSQYSSQTIAGKYTSWRPLSSLTTFLYQLETVIGLREETLQLAVHLSVILETTNYIPGDIRVKAQPTNHRLKALVEKNYQHTSISTSISTPRAQPAIVNQASERAENDTDNNLPELPARSCPTPSINIRPIAPTSLATNGTTDFFQTKFEGNERQPGESILDYAFRLKTLFEKAYPKSEHENSSDAVRLQILRQKFLQGLDPALRNKIRYKPFTTYETMVADTNKYALRMENEKEEIHKREFVNAVNGHSGLHYSEIQKLQVVIQEENEKICALNMKKTDNPGFDLHTEVRQLSHNVARLMEQFNNRTNNSNFRTGSQEYYEQPPNNLFRHGQERQSYDRPSQK
ncbi:Uncharacterized protein APZ42_014027 [Daphnia magna]|uniref:Uncharacterized protein n=1 Tax=Daphnia magna TaxID=35525 RepID=A0A162QAB5_9CRUS|nr:Uncharacterized protein APZ42_014027 [Daphnia magna]